MPRSRRSNGPTTSSVCTTIRWFEPPAAGEPTPRACMPAQSRQEHAARHEPPTDRVPRCEHRAPLTRRSVGPARSERIGRPPVVASHSPSTPTATVVGAGCGDWGSRFLRTTVDSHSGRAQSAEAQLDPVAHLVLIVDVFGAPAPGPDIKETRFEAICSRCCGIAAVVAARQSLALVGPFNTPVTRAASSLAFEATFETAV